MEKGTSKTEYETKSGYGLHHLKLRLRKEVKFGMVFFYPSDAWLHWSNICTGGKGLSDFCKSSSTTVEGSGFFVNESMVYVCVVC